MIYSKIKVLEKCEYNCFYSVWGRMRKDHNQYCETFAAIKPNNV